MENDLLTLYPVFGELPDEARWLARWPNPTVPQGTLLFDEQQACEAFPLVLDGVIRVFKQSAQGREMVLYRIYPGEGCIVSLSCLIDRRAYSARAVAESTARLLMMPQEAFRRWQSESPAFQRYLLGLFSARVEDLMQKVEEMAFLSLEARLAGVLLGHGTVVHKSHAQLANELNTVREIVSRHLKEFEIRGWVKLGRENVAILDVHALRQLATGNR